MLRIFHPHFFLPFALILLYITSACISKTTNVYRLGIDSYSNPKLVYYLERYIAICDEVGSRCSDHLLEGAEISINFGNIKDIFPYSDKKLIKLGVCILRQNPITRKMAMKSIVIDNIAKSFSYKKMLSLVAHEAEHCIRNQPHDNAEGPHLMNPYNLNDYYIDNDVEYYIKASLNKPFNIGFPKED